MNDRADGAEQLSSKSDETGAESQAGPAPEGGAESTLPSPDERPETPLTNDEDPGAFIDTVEVPAAPAEEESDLPAMAEPLAEGDIAAAAEGGTAAAPAEGPKAPAPAAAETHPPAAAPPESFRIGPAGSTLLVRHGLMRTVGQFRHEMAALPAPGTKVVIRTDRGVEMGEVVVGVGSECSHRCTTPEALGRFVRACAGAYPLRSEGAILRVANAQDLIDHRHLESGAREEAAYCRQQIRELGLKMRLVTVEHTLGGERILFYFTSEQRVDFRELVRRLATQYRTRIEMRQVGARDEARIAADYERCGQRCCCQSFLKELQPVSMRMAKVQKATLDPSKISGRCGRLMCCLRYEDLTYEDLRKKLPRKSIWVRTAEKVGRVIETQILTQLVRLALPDGTVVAVPNESILERDVPAPPMQAPSGPPSRGGPGSPPGSRGEGSRNGPPDRRGGARQRQWPQSGPVGASRVPDEASQSPGPAPGQAPQAAEAQPAGRAYSPDNQPPTEPVGRAYLPDSQPPAGPVSPSGDSALPDDMAAPIAPEGPAGPDEGVPDTGSDAGDGVDAAGAQAAPAGPLSQAGGRPPQSGGRPGWGQRQSGGGRHGGRPGQPGGGRPGSGPGQSGGRPGAGSPQGAGSSQGGSPQGGGASQGGKSHHRHRRRGGRGRRPPQAGPPAPPQT